MSRLAIAAAGTGGHVYPGLAVADALTRQGVDPGEIVFFGGARLERRVVPAAGYPFVELELQGLRRSLSPRNLQLPVVVAGAARRAQRELKTRRTRVVLATGGYVTVPVGWAAHRARVPLLLQEQNATPGLANRLMARWAQRVFLASPRARSRLSGEVVGNPLRPEFDDYDRALLRPEARRRYRLDPAMPVLGAMGGSLGARVINEAVAGLVEAWTGPDLAVIHIAGPEHAAGLAARAETARIPWRVVPFEEHMHQFYAAADLVVCRGSAVTISELAVTGTPGLLVPRLAARDRHQHANAEELVDGDAARVISEPDLGVLPGVVRELIGDPERLGRMAAASRAVGRPGAAEVIAAAMLEVADG